MTVRKGRPAGVAVVNVIRKKKGHAEEPHNAAWKIAYADFMTAMMAFFLVMWLTSNMSQDAKKGIAHYFDPIGTTNGASGVGGILGGKTITADGPLSQMSAATKINPPFGSETDSEEGIGAFKSPDQERYTAEQETLEEIQRQLQQAIQESPILQEFVDFVQISFFAEGLRIDLIENYHKPMFALGSSVLTKEAKELLDLVGDSLKNLPNKIHIIGHTDALAYSGTRFTNWELSGARATETRRYLVERTPALNVDAVVGKADVDLYVPENPQSPLNRRISILIFRQFEQMTQKAAPSASTIPQKESALPQEKETAVSELLQIQEIH